MYAQLIISAGMYSLVWFDLQNGDIAKIDHTGGSDCDGIIEDLGSGWYRCIAYGTNRSSITTSAAWGVAVSTSAIFTGTNKQTAFWNPTHEQLQTPYKIDVWVF